MIYFLSLESRTYKEEGGEAVGKMTYCTEEGEEEQGEQGGRGS